MIPQLDRIGGAIGQVSIFFNTDVRGQFLNASGTPPKLTGNAGGYPEYNGWVLITRDRRLPWIPQTLADKLDVEGARRREALAEWNRTRAGMKPMDQAAIQKTYEMLKKSDAAGAEKFLADMNAQRQELTRQQQQVYPARTAALEQQVKDYEQYPRVVLSGAIARAGGLLGDVSGDGKRKLDAELAALRKPAAGESRQAQTERIGPLVTAALARYDLTNLQPGPAERAIGFKPDPSFPDTQRARPHPADRHLVFAGSRPAPGRAARLAAAGEGNVRLRGPRGAPEVTAAAIPSLFAARSAIVSAEGDLPCRVLPFGSHVLSPVFARSRSLVTGAPVLQAQKPEAAAVPNYDLAAQWTSQKVSKLVFDTSVSARWLETSDRFWYAYRTREGRRFMLVDPVKRTKAPLFDHARLAATLTTITGMPFDAQHLPFSTGRLVKKDTAFEFDVQVPADAVINAPIRRETTDGAAQGGRSPVRQQDFDEPQQRGGQGAAAGAGARPAPRNRTLHFEYDLASARLTLLDNDPHDARPPRWASFSPDGKTVVFARKENLFMMDADNFAKAVKKADDPTIVEAQLTKDGEEHYSYGRTAREIQNQREQEQQQQQQQQDEEGGQQQDEERDMTDPTGRMPAVNLVWSRDSNKFALIRRDSRKVSDLFVINALAQPRPTLETYRYAMPGEANIPQSEVHVFDRTSKRRVTIKEDRFPDQTRADRDRACSRTTFSAIHAGRCLPSG